MNRSSAPPSSDPAGSSIINLAETLRAVITSPSNNLGDSGLLAALSSQGNLANFCCEERSIVRMSLNHQKKIAERALGSFQQLDSLRRAAKHAIENCVIDGEEPKSRNKKNLQQRIHSLEDRVQTLLEDLFLLQTALDVRNRQAHQYATLAGEAVRERCLKEQWEVNRTLTLRKAPQSSNISSIDEARERAQIS